MSAVLMNQGTRKAAILLMSLGEDRAAATLHHLPTTEVQALGVAMAKLSQVSKEELAAVLSEFRLDSRLIWQNTGQAAYRRLSFRGVPFHQVDTGAHEVRLNPSGNLGDGGINELLGRCNPPGGQMEFGHFDFCRNQSGIETQGLRIRSQRFSVVTARDLDFSQGSLCEC